MVTEEEQQNTRITLFCTFLCCRFTPATWNFLISCARFMESVHRTQKLSFSSSNLRYSPFRFNPRKFCQHSPNEMRLNKVRWSLKLCEFCIAFWVTFLVCCHLKVLLPWPRDVMTSPLYSPRYKTPLLKIVPWLYDCMSWMRNPLTPSAREYIYPTNSSKKETKNATGFTWSKFELAGWNVLKTEKRGK